MTILHEAERRAIAEMGRRLEAEGLLALTAGNLSTRLGLDLIAISPSWEESLGIEGLVVLIGVRGESCQSHCFRTFSAISIPRT